VNGVALCLLGVFTAALATGLASPLARRLVLLFGSVATAMLMFLEVLALVLALRVEDEVGAKILWEVANTGFPFTGFPLAALLITFAFSGRPGWLAKAALAPAAILFLGAVAFATPALSFARAAAFPLFSLWLVVAGAVWLRAPRDT
jgi:hypothetical protein